MVGYLLLVFAADIKLLLVSTVVRSAGSAVLWIYSTLMLQYIVPNQLLGRVMALEMALFTVRVFSSYLFHKYAVLITCSKGTSVVQVLWVLKAFIHMKGCISIIFNDF